LAATEEESATCTANYHVDDGRITRAWVNWDLVAVMEQIGCIERRDRERMKEEQDMNRKKKLTIAAAVLLTVLVPGAALATPPSGLTSQLLARGAAGEFRIEDKTTDIDFKAKIPTDVAMVAATLAPGGFTGWHAHPGPSVVIVKSGTLTMYEPHDGTCSAESFGPGQAFVHPADVHNFVNNGPDVVEFYVTYFVPAGAAPLLIDAPAPTGC
jgi:quercetin dioxygenase-like cupin family protein